MAIPDKPLTRQEQYLDAIAKKGGGGGSALPSVTSADNGKVLSVVDGAWAAEDKKFVVTLTPTAPDYSGVMDKTCGELYNAYIAKKDIWFASSTFVIPCTLFATNDSGGIHMAAHAILDADNMMVVVETMAAEGDIVNTYTTTIYQLTPMGS